MSFDAFLLPAVVLLSLVTLILLISHDWRLSISALGLMYLGVFVRLLSSWRLDMAVVKSVAGSISASVLRMGMVNLDPDTSQKVRYWPSEILFRISAAGLVGLVTFTVAPSLRTWLPGISFGHAFGGLIVMGMGLLHLGFTLQPLRTVIGLLTFFAGFEILYATIEASVLVAGFLAVINLSVALIGAYLLVAPTMEAEA